VYTVGIRQRELISFAWQILIIMCVHHQSMQTQVKANWFI
jgi:hypothetical protein